MDRAPKFENIALPSMLHEIMRDTHNSWDKNPFPIEHAHHKVVHKTTYISTFEVVCGLNYLSSFELLPSPIGFVPKEKVTTIENFKMHKMIREHIQQSKKKYCKKLSNTKEKQKWQLSEINFQTNTYALFDDFRRYTRLTREGNPSSQSTRLQSEIKSEDLRIDLLKKEEMMDTIQPQPSP